MPLLVAVLMLVMKTTCLYSQPLWQSWDEVTRLAATTNKPVLIDVYTKWCRYCRVMSATTYKHDSVVNFLQQHYLRFKFNAESKDTLKWNDQVFAYNKEYKTHNFAVYLTGGRLSYPTTVIIMPRGQPFYQQGILAPMQMEFLLKYFISRKTEDETMEAFAAEFKPTWK